MGSTAGSRRLLTRSSLTPYRPIGEDLHVPTRAFPVRSAACVHEEHGGQQSEQDTGPGQRLTPGRVDLRMALGPEGRVFLLNKHDGTLRAIVP